MPAGRKGYVGVFDSGVGGISVLKALVARLSHEDFLYFGDSANAPYGERSRDWVLRRSGDIAQGLLDRGCKAIVIACNTATSVAAASLRADFAHVPIIGVEPALKPAALALPEGRILVMATPVTLRLDKYQQLAARWGLGHEVVEVPCAGLAARVEQGDLDAEDVTGLVERLVGAYRGQVDGVVLGCTHYAFVAGHIRRVLGDVPLFDGACGTARQLERRLAEGGLLTRFQGAGSVEFLSSSPDDSEIGLYESLFAQPLP